MATKADTVDSIGEQTADHEEDSHPMKNGATTTKSFTINSTEQGMDSQPLQNDAISESNASGDHSISEQSAHVNGHPGTVPNGSTTLQTGCHGSNAHCEANHLSQPLGDHDIHDQQENSSKFMNGADDDDDTTRPIIVTGFGGFSSGESNLSATVMQEFYRQTSKKISILTGCPDMMNDPDNLQPIETSYKFVLTPPFDPWLKFTNARLAVHLGTNDEISGNEILFELQACNGGADFWYADGYATPCSMYRKECITGGSQYLQTSFDIPTLIEKVNERVSNTTCAGEENMKFSFKESKDAGHFLCDYLYYRSLYYATQRGNGAKNVIFIHIPPAFNLSVNVTAEDFAVHFASVLEQIVYCLLDMCSSDSGNKGETRPLHGSTAVENGDNEKVTNGVGNGLEEESHHACKDSLTLPQNGHHKERMLSCYGQSPPCAADHRNQQEIISRPLNQTPTVFKNAVVVTGFDPVYGKLPNQSWIIVQKFCSQLQQRGGQRVIEHNSVSFQLMTGPPDRPNKPITTTYDYVTKCDFNNWLQSSNALLYIHVGVDGNLNSESGNVISFTTVAYNGHNGYWEPDKNKFYRFPGPCIENSGDDYLYTQFSEEQLSGVISRLPAEVRNAKINGTFTFQQMTDKSKCGNFLCDFLYYRSLYYAKQRNERASSDDDRKSYVIFIHIPSKLNPSNLAGAAPMALVLNLIVLALLDIVVTPKL